MGKSFEEIRMRKQLVPLTSTQKCDIVNELKKRNSQELLSALISAALALETFPLPLNEDLVDMQTVLRKHQANQKVSQLQQAVIAAYIESDGIQKFQTLLNVPLVESAWPSSFLYSLIDNLDIQLESQALVEVAIQDGQLFWRLVKDGIDIYNRQKCKVEIFDDAKVNTVKMTWEQFLQFKHSGKRSSTVVITKERFQAYFTTPIRAGRIWDELKKKDILTASNKISQGWRLASNVTIKLQSIDEKSPISYQAVADALFKIASDSNNQETLLPGEKYVLFRPERSYKVWCTTGLVRNKLPTDQLYCTHKWDVSTYVDLTNHSVGGSGLEFDHIPSADQMKTESTERHNQNLVQVKALQNQFKVLTGKIDLEKGKILQKTKVATRRETTLATNDEIVALEEQKNDVDEKINYIKIEDSWIVDQNKGHQNACWVIAIAEKLHQAGVTFMQPSTKQKNDSKLPFFKETEDYLNKIEEKPQYFLGMADNYFYALGALRYLYRCQVKPASIVNAEYASGVVPPVFFEKSPVLRQQLDQLFQERLERFVQQREGFQHSI